MGKLVFLEPNRFDSEPFTTSDVIAEYAEVNYRSIQRIIEKHESDFREFGQVRFQITPVKYSRGTNEKKIYLLNEQQATLLITYLKNTAPVREFKKELVRQFYSMRNEVLQRRLNREAIKPVRRELTDVVKEVDAGKWAYKKYLDLAYKTTLGKNAKQLRLERGAPKNANATDYLTATEMDDTKKRTGQIAVLLELGLDYKQVKSTLELKQA